MVVTKKSQSPLRLMIKTDVDQARVLNPVCALASKEEKTIGLFATNRFLYATSVSVLDPSNQLDFSSPILF